jgi:hypothetical protein
VTAINLDDNGFDRRSRRVDLMQLVLNNLRNPAVESIDATKYIFEDDEAIAVARGLGCVYLSYPLTSVLLCPFFFSTLKNICCVFLAVTASRTLCA